MGIFGRIKAWIKGRAGEDELKRLTDQELKDLGLTRAEASAAALRTKGYGS